MNEQHNCFDSEMRKFSLLCDTDHSLPFLKSEASLYDDYQSSLPLGPSFVDDASLTALEEVFDPHFTFSSFVALSFSSTPIDATINALTLLFSSLPLAQCTGLEMGKPSKGDVSVIEGDSLD